MSACPPYEHASGSGATSGKRYFTAIGTNEGFFDSLRQFIVRIFLMLWAMVALLQTGVAAQTAPPVAGRHAMHLIKLPNGDYTVPLDALKGSSTSGKVLLHPQGLKTIVTVFVFGDAGRPHTFNLHSGKDCNQPGAQGGIALAPTHNAQPSRTIVSLPIANLTSKDYVISALNATTRAQFKEACARL